MRGMASEVIVKIVTLFLIVIAVLAMFGRLKLRLPGRDRLARGTCPHCGRHRIGKGPCPCGEGRG
ncbi:MAG: hypothetical protein ACWA5A_18255 [Marinibacterium sp.]